MTVIYSSSNLCGMPTVHFLFIATLGKKNLLLNMTTIICDNCKTLILANGFKQPQEHEVNLEVEEELTKFNEQEMSKKKSAPQTARLSLKSSPFKPVSLKSDRVDISTAASSESNLLSNIDWEKPDSSRYSESLTTSIPKPTTKRTPSNISSVYYSHSSKPLP